MHIIRRLEQILTNLQPVFSRHATYEWFVILIWGILLCNQHRAVTSYLNAVGLTQHYYIQALHWFHINADMKHPSPKPTLKRSSGRPRVWGESVKLRNLFDEKDCFTTETLLLYGKVVTLRYRCCDLHWDSSVERVRFGKRCVARGQTNNPAFN